MEKAMLAPTVCLLALHFVASHDWNLSDVKDMTLAVALEAYTPCILIIQPDQPTLAERQEKYKLAGQLMRVKDVWHPQVGIAPSFAEVARVLDLIKSAGRDACSRPLFIVVANNETKGNLEMLSKSYRFSNSIWLLYMTAPVTQQYFSNMTLPLNSALHIALHAGARINESVTLYEVYSVADHPKKVLPIGNWSRKEGLNLASTSVIVRRGNLEGLVIRTASLENWPITSFTYTSNTTGHTIDGYFAKLWFELEAIMNFTSVHLKSVEDISGRELEGGKWNGLLGMAVRGEVDVLLTELSMTPSRLKAVDFIQPLIRTKYQVYFRFSGFVLEWSSVLRPFSSQVWLCLVAWILGSTAIIFCIGWASVQFQLDPTLPRRSSSPVPAFFFVLQTLCNQGTARVPKGGALRFMFVLCYLTATVILPSYSGALISALTKKTAAKPFDDLDGLLREKTPLLVWVNTADYELFSKATVSPYKEIFALVNPTEEMRAMRGYKDMLRYICNHQDVAMLGVETNLEATAARRASQRKRRNRRDDCRALTFSQGLSPIHQTIAFNKNSSYKELVNFNLMVMRERGLLNRYQRHYFPARVNTWSHHPEFLVTIKECAPTFTFLALGILLSVVILFCEISSYRQKYQQENVILFKYSD